MGHAHHYLSRLDRLTDTRQLEDAKRLYNHGELIAHLLERANVPDSYDRAAFSMSDPREGPWIVTTRSGDFVTVLAQGMTPNATTFRVAPDVLKTAMAAHAQVHGYLEAFARYKSRSGAPKDDALLGWVLKRPHQVTREDARALAGFRFLAPQAVVSTAVKLQPFITRKLREFSQARTPSHQARTGSTLVQLELGRAHLLVSIFAMHDAPRAPRAPIVETAFAFALAMQTVPMSTPNAVRGLWALRAAPDLDTECVARFHGATADLCPSHAFAVGVAAIIARPDFSTQERLMRLDKLAAACPPTHSANEILRRSRLAVTNPEASIHEAVDAGRALYLELTAGLPAGHPLAVDHLAQIPQATALATFYSIDTSMEEEPDNLPSVISAMPHFMRAPLDELYLPAATLVDLYAASETDDWHRRHVKGLKMAAPSKQPRASDAAE